jgi:hypothetical protein
LVDIQVSTRRTPPGAEEQAEGFVVVKKVPIVRLHDVSVLGSLLRVVQVAHGRVGEEVGFASDGHGSVEAFLAVAFAAEPFDEAAGLMSKY